jgi:Tol biopolymer transport system component
MCSLAVLPLMVQAQLPGVTETLLSNAQHAGSDVDEQSLLYSPNGQYVCFIGDTETDNANELWCADTDAGSPAVRVSGILPTGTSVQRPQFSDDGQLIFYVAPGPVATNNDLFMVTPDGASPPVRLNAALQPSGVGVGRFRYLPATRQMIYQADSLVLGQSRLHVVSLDEPEVATVLNGPLVANGEVDSFDVAPDTGRVVYLADQQTAGVVELYSVQLNGAGAVKLNGSLTGGGDVFSFELSPDGTRVAYLADEDLDDVFEMFVTPIDGGGSTKVSGTAVAGGDARFYLFSPDSQWLLFTGDLATNGWRDLYSTRADGAQPTPNVLATQIQEAPEPPVLEVLPDIFVTADGTQVLFLSLQGNAASKRALRAPIDGSTPAAVLSGGLTNVDFLRYLPGIERILIRNRSTSENFYSIAVNGSSFIPLTSFSGSAIDVIGQETSRGLVYFADPVIDEQFSAFFVDYLGQATRELSSNDPFFEGLASAALISEDSDAVYFVERRGSFFPVFSSFRLRVANLDSLTTSELAILSNSALAPGDREFLSVLPSPVNPYQVTYVADQAVDEQADAYLAALKDGIFVDRFE